MPVEPRHDEVAVTSELHAHQVIQRKLPRHLRVLIFSLKFKRGLLPRLDPLLKFVHVDIWGLGDMFSIESLDCGLHEEFLMCLAGPNLLVPCFIKNLSEDIFPFRMWLA